MTYPKPLSPRTIARKYSESGMTGNQIDFLHEFFLAAARLYGVTRVGDLWVIYKELGRHQKVVEVRRRDMLTFSAIARRENLPYRIYELNEVYVEDEPSELQRMVISKDILSKAPVSCRSHLTAKAGPHTINLLTSILLRTSIHVKHRRQ